LLLRKRCQKAESLLGIAVLKQFLSEIIRVLIGKHLLYILALKQFIQADATQEFISFATWVKLRSTVLKEPLQKFTSSLVNVQTPNMWLQELKLLGFSIVLS